MSPGQVAVRWSLQKLNNVGIAIPRSHTAAHMATNLEPLAFTLTASDMSALDKLPQSKVGACPSCRPGSPAAGGGHARRSATDL